jgi:hypothetical protein
LIAGVILVAAGILAFIWRDGAPRSALARERRAGRP